MLWRRRRHGRVGSSHMVRTCLPRARACSKARHTTATERPARLHLNMRVASRRRLTGAALRLSRARPVGGETGLKSCIRVGRWLRCRGLLFGELRSYPYMVATLALWVLQYCARARTPLCSWGPPPVSDDVRVI
eukprot:6201382-Pleurochrysis_carterae.AAC.1